MLNPVSDLSTETETHDTGSFHAKLYVATQAHRVGLSNNEMTAGRMWQAWGDVKSAQHQQRGMNSSYVIPAALRNASNDITCKS